jgi:hypothetical protein
MFLSGQVRLVDNQKLRQQFVSLERRVHPNGRESVDDSGATSANDDLSNSCAGAMVLASVAPKKMNFAPPTGSIHRNPAMRSGPEYAGFDHVPHFPISLKG